MSINKFRGKLYWAAKALGDVQSVSQAAKKKSASPIGKRVARRIVGKFTGRLMGRLFPPSR